jgi:CDP-diacylglycerol--serine O-phosphatidyltransferase
VAELPLLALKFKHFGWKGNEFRFILIFSSVLSIILFQYLGIVIAILLYVLISVIHNLTRKLNN